MAHQPDPSKVRIEHPNRKKASSKVTRLIVVLLLLASAAVVVLISYGGWDTLEGAKPVQVLYVLLYVLMAVFILRWARGVLPVAAAFAIILLIFAAVSGPQWFDRDKTGFTDPTFDEGVIGLLTFILVPLQVLLIGFSMQAFAQKWNVEVEHPIDQRGQGQDGSPYGGQPVPA